ncbi:4Fe-4S binding protein [Gordonia sp. zg691]|uniref:4Fe-4S binding protein n=1 Tax=Gordonia jinghuaiqii TaxID=2758710 RepID=A0A7D7RS97_9ACTN|nr:4Fe-4S binding protein [Gordonia jinghuaiqii]MBD0862206.1 4Fe-4S binding protein [Gordonia jinghuaiqii]MCR5978570.1 4Fe-4S dicluster domain-containing protein [Gordonia jinghuaiqii]QMT02893.1 4Fe-4S binding protein [Gordonia jinghuaiqii]
MPHVVTQACCGDASCVYACPVNCIHPTPEEPDFGIAEMLYIDPSTCVDCGACVSACPVGAIVPGHRLPAGQERFADVNAAQYQDSADGAARFPVDPSLRLPLAPVDRPHQLAVDDRVSIGIVGSGPSAMYAADELLRQPQISVTMYERLDKPFGLARFGVAPDHLHTRGVMRLFDDIARDPRLEILLDTEVGRDITLDELRSRHAGVVWAGGAPTDKSLDLPGIAHAGVASATSFVGWYNGHPDFTDLDVDLATERAVVIGNGNVALDVARILVADPDSLAETSISRAALAQLRRSSVREVVVMGRRGPAHAAFTLPELIGLVDSGVAVTVDPADLRALPAAADLDATVRAKLDLLAECAARPEPTGRRIRLAFYASPLEVVAGQDGRARGLIVGRNRPTTDAAGFATGIEPTGDTSSIDAGTVLTSVGYRGVAVPGLPFDDARGVIPHREGRVMSGTDPVTGVYVTGWIKRGPSGFIGTNKTDSAETVASLLADLESGRLGVPASRRRRFRVRA